MHRWLHIAFSLVLLLGCGPDSTTDAGSDHDTGTSDAGSTDSGQTDADLDAGPTDAGPTDAGPIDAGPFDGGPDAAPDAGLDAATDAGDPDAGPPSPRYLDCDSTRVCAVGFMCEGYVASIERGKCVPTTVPAGEGASCGALEDCADGLLCGGYTRGFGLCLPAWMRESFSENGLTVDIPDGSSGGLTRTLTVYGIATVDMDVVVDLAIDHPAPSELRISLRNPGGTEAVVYDGSAESDPPGRLVVEGPVFGFSGDESVNGDWTLTVVDGASGNAGSLDRWTLTVASRYD
ncbi:MAG: proprotein convertase P-domain-containing protein [Sandaracinaceae bacterium]